MDKLILGIIVWRTKKNISSYYIIFQKKNYKIDTWKKNELYRN